MRHLLGRRNHIASPRRVPVPRAPVDVDDGAGGAALPGPAIVNVLLGGWCASSTLAQEAIFRSRALGAASSEVVGGDPLAERVEDEDPFHLSAVAQILGVEFAAAESAGGGDDGAVPVGELVL